MQELDRAVLSVPLFGRQGTIGVIQVLDAEVDRIGPTDQRLLELFNRVITTTTFTLDAKQVLEVACRELAHAFELPQAAAALLNAEGTEATVVAEHLAPGRPSALGRFIPVTGNPATEYVLAHQAPLALTDAQTHERLAAVRDLMRERGTVSLLIVPILLAPDRVAGTIGLDAIERREFSQEEVTVAQSVAAAVGQALQTARLYQALQRHAEQLEEMVGQGTAELQAQYARLEAILHSTSDPTSLTNCVRRSRRSNRTWV